MKTFKLHLVRHGLTQGNLDGVYVGGTDVPICDKGFEQLRQLKAAFAYPSAPIMFTSPMQRARQTAEVLFPDIKEIIVVEDLRENNFGEFEGQSVAALKKNPDFLSWLDPESGFVPKGGESGKDFAKRVDNALMQMLAHMMKNSIFEAVCIGHGGVFMTMLSQRAMPQKPASQWMTDNGCGFTIQTSAAMLMRDGLVEAVSVVPDGYLA